MSSSEMRSQRLVGRANEVALPGRVLEEVPAERAYTLLLSGEAGIGKSRLVREALRLAAARDFLILHGRCFEQDASLPYAPLADLVRDLVRRGHTSPRVSRLVPQLTQALRKLTDPSAIALPDDARAHAKRQLEQDLRKGPLAPELCAPAGLKEVPCQKYPEEQSFSLPFRCIHCTNICGT